MTEEFKKNAKIAFVALFCALWLGLTFLAPRTPWDPAWTSREAKAYLEASMKQFCTGVYPGGECPDVAFGGQRKLFKVTRAHAHRALSLDLVTAVLTDKGWLLTDPRDGDRTVFCRDGYAAVYSTNGESVWVSFLTGERICLM